MKNNKFKAPALSTSFSGNGRQARQRFENILNTKAKKNGLLTMFIISVLAIICCSLISYKNADEKLWGENVAIITENTPLYKNADFTEKYTDLQKDDLVYVVYRQTDDIYYIQTAYRSVPAVEGYINKKYLTFEFEKANQGVLLGGAIYLSPDENDVYYKNSSNYTVEIVNEIGEWTQINLHGGDDLKWTKTDNISYDFTPYDVDLSYTDTQRRADQGYQWVRYLDSEQVIRDFLADLKYGDIEKLNGFEYVYDEPYSKMVSFIDDYGRPLSIRVHQPLKKDETGIWVVDKETIKSFKMHHAIPKNISVIPNSGMAWTVNIDGNREIELKEYGNPKDGIKTDTDTALKNLGLNPNDFYNKDIDVKVYVYDAGKTTTGYVFAFDGTKLLTAYELKTQKEENIVKNILISLAEEEKK